LVNSQNLLKHQELDEAVYILLLKEAEAGIRRLAPCPQRNRGDELHL